MKSLRERLEESIPDEEAFLGAKLYGDGAIKQGNWLTEPLWNNYAWGLKLKHSGISWTEFMEAYGRTQYSFLRWKEGEQTWEEAMEDFIDAIVQIR